jgi:hypothetical protein
MSINNKQTMSYVEFREAEVPQPYEKKDPIGFVKWGNDNLYPQFLYRLLYESPLQSGIINTKVKYITSGGLNYEGNDLAKWEQIKNNGKSKYTLDELLPYISQDFEVTESFYLKCTKNITTGLFEFDVLDAELMRNDENGIYFYYSENWIGSQSVEKTGFKKYKSIQYIDPTDIEVVLYVSGKSKQIRLDNGKLTSNIYPMPNYSGGIVSIMADIEMNHFHYSESVNSFAGGTMISLNNGVPSEEDKREIEKKYKDAVTDRKKKGGVVIAYADGKEREASITQISGTDLDKRYIETQKFIVDSVMIAHGVINPSLFGVKTSGQLGTTQELETSFLIFKQNYITARQKIISDALTYANMKLNDLSGTIGFNDYNLVFDASSDETNIVGDTLNKMSPLLANKVLSTLTTNEIRAIAKLPPIEGGDMIPTTAPQQFNHEDRIISQFKNIGVPKKDLTFVKSRPIEKFDNLESDEADFLAMHQIESFASVTSKDKKILGLINQGVSYNDLVRELNQTPKEVSAKLLDLEKNGYLEKNNGRLEVSRLGQAEIEQTQFRILYTYEKRDDAPPLKTESREFCREMLKLDRAYLRTEIDQIQNDEGTSVWLYRGGWYANPETGKNQPSCRHFWKMNIVID